MSIAMTIEYKDSKRDPDYVPIVGSKGFRLYWLPGCSELGLKWVESISWMIDLKAQSDILPDLIDELSQLREYVNSPSAELSQNASEDTVAHIEDLIQWLEYVQKNLDVIQKAVIV